MMNIAGIEGIGQYPIEMPDRERLSAGMFVAGLTSWRGQSEFIDPFLEPRRRSNREIHVGCGAAAITFRLLPPLSSAFRARRMLALTLRDLRRIAMGPLPPTSEEWESRMYGRLAAFPDMAEPLQRVQLLAAFSAGNEIMELRHMGRSLALNPQLDTALVTLAHGNSGIAIAQLAGLDHRLGSHPGAESEADLALRARARILALSELLAQHAPYFDAGAPA